MKTKPHLIIALLFLGSQPPLAAQNPAGTSIFQEHDKSVADAMLRRMPCGTRLEAHDEVPEIHKAQGMPPGENAVYAAQDMGTLDAQVSARQDLETVVDLDLLRNPSPYRKLAVGAKPQPYEIQSDSLQNGLAMISAVYRESGKPEADADCSGISLSIEQRIKLDAAKVLEVVESEVTSNPGCSCEIVKAAIKASEADVALVVSIAECAITAAPENMRIISQCAIASQPEAVAEIQALLARLDPNSGDAGAYSSKSSKSAKDAKDARAAAVIPAGLPNPLDLPGYFMLIPPIIPPIIVPPVTEVNPGSATSAR